MNAEPLFNSPAQPAGLPMVRACVLEVSEGQFRVRHSMGVCDAPKAFACLVEPEVGDEVLLAFEETGAAYILSILERPTASATRIATQGDLEISADTCRVQGRESVNVVTPGNLNLVSGASTLETGKVSARFGDATLMGKVLTSSVDVVRGFHDLVDQSVKTMMQRAGTYLRQTDSLDHVKAAQMDRSVGGLFNLNTKFTVMMSAKDTKIDGERIHMG